MTNEYQKDLSRICIHRDARVTIDHGVIKDWVDQRDGQPAVLGDIYEPSSPHLIIYLPSQPTGRNRHHRNGEGRLAFRDWRIWKGLFEESQSAFWFREHYRGGRNSLSHFYQITSRLLVPEHLLTTFPHN